MTQAGSVVSGFPESEEPTVEELRAFVSLNEDAWQLSQAALDQDGCVQIDYSGSLSQAIENTTFRWSTIGTLCSAHATIAEHEERYVDAAESCLKLLQFADKASRNGMIAHGLKAAAYERKALTQLAALVDKLSPEDRASILATLRNIRRPPRNLTRAAELEQQLFHNEHGKLAGSFMQWQAKRMGIANQAIDAAKKIEAEFDQRFNDVETALSISPGTAVE